MAAYKSKTTKKGAGGAQAAGGKTNPTMDWLVGYMRKNPNAVYADANGQAQRAGHKIYPIMWGRAQVMLGRVKQKPRGTGAAAKKAAAQRASSGSGAAAPARAAAAPAAEPKRRGRPPGSGRKAMGTMAPAAKTAGAGRMSIPVASGDIGRMQQLVDALNRGAGATLRYDGAGWSLTIG